MKKIIHFDHLALLKPYTSYEFAWFYVFDKQSPIKFFITISVDLIVCFLSKCRRLICRVHYFLFLLHFYICNTFAFFRLNTVYRRINKNISWNQKDYQKMQSLINSDPNDLYFISVFLSSFLLCMFHIKLKESVTINLFQFLIWNL